MEQSLEEVKEIYFEFFTRMIKQTLKDIGQELKKKSGLQHVGYPFLILDEDNFLVGFDEEDYKELFSIE